MKGIPLYTVDGPSTASGPTMKDLWEVKAKFPKKTGPSHWVMSSRVFLELKGRCQKSVLGDHWLLGTSPLCTVAVHVVGSYDEFHALMDRLNESKEDPNDWALIEDDHVVGWRARLRFADLVENG